MHNVILAVILGLKILIYRYNIPVVYKTLYEVNQEARLGPKRELIL